MKLLRIAYVSEDDSLSCLSWSGIPYSIRKALQASGVDLVALTPERVDAFRHSGFAGWFRRQPFASKSDRYSLHSMMSLGASTRKLVEQAHNVAPLDFVLSIHPDPIAYAGLNIPCGFIGDCNFELLSQTYPMFSKKSSTSLTQGADMWMKGLESAAFCALASEWAASDAILRYPSLKDKINVVPFGANIVSGWSEEEIAARIGGRFLDPLRLLCVGVEWDRKRMDEVLEVHRILISQGINSRLDIVGCLPSPACNIPSGATIHGRLSRSNPAEASTLKVLFENAHIFILASCAECFGIVFAEAGSFALPSLAVASCGIPSAVRDGITGRLFAKEGWKQAVASEIISLMNEPERYRLLARNAWADSVERLNWDVIAKQLLEHIRGSLKRDPSR